MTTTRSWPVQAILFDLDGTLVDSSRDITAAANAALATLGVSPRPADQVIRHVGRGAYNLLSALSGQEGGGVEEAVQVFINEYRQGGAKASRLYPGMNKVLQALEGQLKLAVVSNKPEALVWATLDQLRLDRYFDLVIGGDTLPSKKPDPMPIQWTVQRLHVPLDKVVLVGDSSTDVEAGRRASVVCCGVTWGFGDPRSSAAGPPQLLVDAPKNLLRHFAPERPEQED